MTTLHPTDDELNAFLLGVLPVTDCDRVETHMSVCDDCVGRVTALEGRDTLVELLVAAATRIDAELSAASTPLPQNTPSEVAPTQAWGDVLQVGLDPSLPPQGLANHPRYRLIRQLGQGGMGTVWLAEHTIMRRPVALKVIRPEFLARTGSVERFRREVRAAAQLHHPNIVTAFDADEVDNSHFLVMEYVLGENLLDVVKQGPLPIDEACRIVRDTARGLAYAHATGLVHRDVKPANLIRATDGTVKVLDFGLVSMRAQEGDLLTGENMVIGTPDYIAPEQAVDAHSADARSDVYSLGCTLYHLLAGRVPFPANTIMKKLDAHRTLRMEPIPNIPSNLTAVLLRMTAKRPADRYQATAEVVRAIEPFCGRTPLTDSATRSASRQRSRYRWLSVLVAMVVAATIAAGAVILKIKRDNQEITIESDDPNIEVVIRRNGEIVRIVDTKTNQTWELDAKKMRLRSDGSELSIDLPGEGPLTIRRSGDVAAIIRRTTAAVPVPPTQPIRPISPAVVVEKLDGTSGWVGRVGYHPSGDYLVASGRNVCVWNASTGKPAQKLWASVAGSWAVRYSRDGSLVAATLSGDGVVGVWDTTTWKEVARFGPYPGINNFWGLDISPDNRHVVFSVDFRVIRGNVKTGEAVQVFDEKVYDVRAVAISPDGKRVAHTHNLPRPDGTVDPTLRIWELATGKSLQDFQSPSAFNDSFVDLRWLPDGKRLVAGHARGAVRVWDAETGKVLLKFQAHERLTESVDVSADGTRLLTASQDGHVGLWELDTGRRLAWFEAHFGGALGVAFRPDGKYAASGGKDQTVRFWKLPDAILRPEPLDAGPRPIKP